MLKRPTGKPPKPALVGPRQKTPTRQHENKPPASGTALRSRRYRERQAAKSGKAPDPKKVYPLELSDSMATILAADKRFKPPASPAERAWRKAIAELAACLLRGGK